MLSDSTDHTTAARAGRRDDDEAEDADGGSGTGDSWGLVIGSDVTYAYDPEALRDLAAAIAALLAPPSPSLPPRVVLAHQHRNRLPEGGPLPWDERDEPLRRFKEALGTVEGPRGAAPLRLKLLRECRQPSDEPFRKDEVLSIMEVVSGG